MIIVSKRMLLDFIIDNTDKINGVMSRVEKIEEAVKSTITFQASESNRRFNLSKTQKEHGVRITQIERNLLKIVPKIGSMDAHLAKLNKGNEHLEENLTDEFARLDEAIKANSVRIEGVERAENVLSGNITKLGGKVVWLRDGMVEANKEILRQTSAIEQLHMEIDRTKPRIAFLTRKVAQLQEELNEANKPKPVRKSRAKKPKIKKS